MFVPNSSFSLAELLRTALTRGNQYFVCEFKRLLKLKLKCFNKFRCPGIYLRTNSCIRLKTMFFPRTPNTTVHNLEDSSYGATKDHSRPLGHPL